MRRDLLRCCFRHIGQKVSYVWCHGGALRVWAVDAWRATARVVVAWYGHDLHLYALARASRFMGTYGVVVRSRAGVASSFMYGVAGVCASSPGVHACFLPHPGEWGDGRDPLGVLLAVVGGRESNEAILSAGMGG